ncbi:MULTISPECIES: MFS transporter [Pseudomonas]|uniref:Arabinose ABC transporter permease n=1 Tax=Pseudomonas fluorescens LMG 5329 TaxID=1324332 RepID=A0A0A1Z2V7_PSEFL|nr:MFS transporter [Pseudomonas fluorescens]KGE68635.1 arabinose ABC transporter permease [Pseudomonas fluorescens LMG 5329]NWE01966.1 MFS transporter [Pseudomonas sp. IPO3749]NWF20062.1 MFS transporter [Pseudomonas sp. IPO3749]
MIYLILGLFGLYTLEFGVLGILPMIVERFGISVSQAGWLMGLFALIVAVLGPFLVLLASRLARKKILVGALLGFSVCSVLSAFAPNFETLMALRVIPAMLHPVFFAAAFSTAVSLYPKERAAHATALAVVGTTLGLVLGVPLTTWVGARISYEASFYFCALATAVAALGVLIKLPDHARAAPLSFGKQLAVLRSLSVWLAIIATVLVFSTMFSVYSYAAEYLKTQVGMDGQTISLMLVIFGIGGVVGNLLVGRLLSRHLVVTAVGYPVVLAVAYLVLYGFGSLSWGSMSVIVLLWGAAHTCGLVVTQVWLTSSAPQAHEFATSLYVSSANAGVVIGASMGGLFINAFGTTGVIGCGLVFAGLSLLVIAWKALAFGDAKGLPARA